MTSWDMLLEPLGLLGEGRESFSGERLPFFVRFPPEKDSRPFTLTLDMTS